MKVTIEVDDINMPERVTEVINKQMETLVPELLKKDGWFINGLISSMASKMSRDFEYLITDERSGQFRKELLAEIVRKLDDEDLKGRVMDAIIRR